MVVISLPVETEVVGKCSLVPTRNGGYSNSMTTGYWTL